MDIRLQPIDFSAYKNVTYLKAAQTDQSSLVSIIGSHFPSGCDLVIDDASHIGFYSKILFDTVFPLLNSGGAYFIEDWGTGYWDDWIDGNQYQEFFLSGDKSIPKRIPSHDFGMVGFVKSLVDFTHESAKRKTWAGASSFLARIEALEFGEGTCMILKS